MQHPVHLGRLLFSAAATAAATLLALTPGTAEADPYTGTPTPKVLRADLGRGSGSGGGTGAVAARTGSQSGSKGGLPVTGGDVLQLTVLGLGALGAGTVLVRKSRRLQPR